MTPSFLQLPTLLVLHSILLIGPVGAPDDALEKPSRAEANLFLMRRDYERAIGEFERIVVDDPADGVAWFQLASARHHSGDLQGARPAYERSAQTAAVAAQASYNLACFSALDGEKDAALEWLERAVVAGFSQVQLLTTDPDLESVRGGGHFQQIVDRVVVPPRPNRAAEVAFRETDVEILWVFEADAGLDRFGWQSEAIGDVTGDGKSEILVGGPYSNEAAPWGGKAWLLSGNDGSLVREHLGDVEGGSLGFRCKGAGDINRDGVPDYIVTAPGANSSDGSVPPADAGLLFPGHLFLYSGADGTVLFELAAEGRSDRYGFDAGTVGDLDGDGYVEILVGAPGHDSVAQNAGRVYVLSGVDATILRTHDGARELDRLGSAIGPLGDVDGDTFDDYVVGVPGGGDGKGGVAIVYSGKSGRPIHTLDPGRDLSHSRALEFGRFFASSAGDLNRDGADDIYIADSFDQSYGLAAGRLYLYSGKGGDLLYTIAGVESNDWYGIGRGMHEDFDGDEIPDIVVAALSSNDGGFHAGRVDLRSGADGELIRSYTGTTPHLCLGYDTHPVGDLDGDGVGDLFITGSWGPWHRDLRGRGVAVRGGRK